MPSSKINAFHECFGSPLTAPTTAVWRVGNVTWTGVRLHTLLALAEPLSSAKFVWSEGLDSGVFADVYADRYQKDLPMSKALGPEVLVAYAMYGLPLSPERGGPVRLVVPGWFGTNSTKWLSKLTLSEQRAGGPYTTTFYNIKDPDSETGTIPVWQVEVNSMIVTPILDAVIDGSEVEVEGWAWSHDNVIRVEVSLDGGATWREAHLWPRIDFSWQRFLLSTKLQPGLHTLIARAFSKGGKSQPLSGWRNHSHSIRIEVV